MNLNDLLNGKGIDPKQVLVFRLRPFEPELNKVLPWLAAEKPDLFNAYQQTQGKKLEKVLSSMSGAVYVASFIGLEAGKAQFVGLYRIGKSKPLTEKQYWKVPACVELKAFKLQGFIDNRSAIQWFDLESTDFYAAWKGKLTIGWPPPERSWWRRSHRNEMPILALLEESLFNSVIPEWDAINFSWDELSVLPSRWKTVFAQWRGIYYIYDVSGGKAYVGSAYGKQNLMGRWLNYAATGHGGNNQLLKRDPKNFRFSILQRVSPDMSQEDVVKLENTWKQRLHSHKPQGLNDN